MIAGALILSVLILGVLMYGQDYYRLDISQRVLSPKHVILKPSGSVGLKLGIGGTLLLFSLYLYPLRKKWRWLQKIGKTKNWLDAHVLIGVTAPLMITLHSSFKSGGIAGLAYWMMIVAMVSGYIGRYLYAQIPRSMNATTLTLRELQELTASTARTMEELAVFSADEIAVFTKSPFARDPEKMSLPGVVLAMLANDVQRRFQVAALRRRLMHSTSHVNIEAAVRLARTESWLLAKMALLARTRRLFQLWHVIHRPFSYGFAIFALLHIAVVIWMGYF
jgi:hypothetical protein